VELAIRRIQQSEFKRDPSGIGSKEWGSSHAEQRRASAQALARIASPATEAKLSILLADEDPQTLALAAYGIGYGCSSHTDVRVQALLTRAATLLTQEKSALSAYQTAIEALARALGNCASPQAERALQLWLQGPALQASAAALGLGDLAGKRKLSDKTLVALVQAAGSSPKHAAIPEALVPLSRSPLASASVRERVRELAAQHLEGPPAARRYALRALGHSGENSIAPLLHVLITTNKFSPAERSEAARMLARFDDAGQQALAQALEALSPSPNPVALTSLVSSSFAPLLQTLHSLAVPPPARAVKTLLTLSRLPLPTGNKAPPTLTRRIIQIRCQAAIHLVKHFQDPKLANCSSEAFPVEKERAELAVVGKVSHLSKEERVRLIALSHSKYADIRAKALPLIARHYDWKEAAALFEEGLKHPYPGTVAAAAKALNSFPEWAIVPSKKKATGWPPRLRKALLGASKRTWPVDAVETELALLEAIGAVQLHEALPWVQKACHSPTPALRQTAGQSLQRLGEKSNCSKAFPYPTVPKELEHVAPVTKLIFESDAGELTITTDPEHAPLASTRLVELARTGFFNGMVVHRSVPGVVVQWGDPQGDGTGGANLPMMPCETSPFHFKELSVGVAIAGRDTGSSQFFVALTRVPEWDGNYTQLGTAQGDWGALIEGDIIQRVRLVPP
jgi:cyclophilin family peptidyl-prolyl cis-trans isomerase